MRGTDMTILASTSELYTSTTPYASFTPILRTLLGLTSETEPEAAIGRLEDRDGDRRRRVQRGLSVVVPPAGALRSTGAAQVVGPVLARLGSDPPEDHW